MQKPPTPTATSSAPRQSPARGLEQTLDKLQGALQVAPPVSSGASSPTSSLSPPPTSSAERAAYERSLEYVGRVGGLDVPLRYCQTELSKQGCTWDRAIALLDSVIQRAEGACNTVAACKAAGCRLPAGTWGEREQVERLWGLVAHRLATMRDLRRDMTGREHHLVMCWVVNLRWRFTARASPAELQVMVASSVWDQAKKLWFPGVDMQALLSAAGSRRFL